MWRADRGCFYCDRCDDFIQVNKKIATAPYLIGSWFQNASLGPGATLHGAFMLCRQCGIFLSQGLSNIVSSKLLPDVGCDVCERKLSLSSEPPDQFLSINWSDSRNIPVAQGKPHIHLCVPDAKAFLDELDPQLKYPTRR